MVVPAIYQVHELRFFLTYGRWAKSCSTWWISNDFTRLNTSRWFKLEFISIFESISPWHISAATETKSPMPTGMINWMITWKVCGLKIIPTSGFHNAWIYIYIYIILYYILFIIYDILYMIYYIWYIIYDMLYMIYYIWYMIYYIFYLRIDTYLYLYCILCMYVYIYICTLTLHIWYIYLHAPQSLPHVVKYTSPVYGMGYMAYYDICICM